MENSQEAQIQTFHVPHDMISDSSGLVPRDLLVYVSLIRFDNQMHECFPSIGKISKITRLSPPTVIKSISMLEKAGYLEVKRLKRKNYYYFPKDYSHFEMFTNEFLDSDELDPKQKSIIIAIMQYLYKKNLIGTTTFSNTEICQKINISRSSWFEFEKEMKQKNFLEVVNLKMHEIDTGCSKQAKMFALRDLGLAVINKVAEHDQKLEQVDKDMSLIFAKIQEQQKAVEFLLRKSNISMKELQEEMEKEITL